MVTPQSAIPLPDPAILTKILLPRRSWRPRGPVSTLQKRVRPARWSGMGSTRRDQMARTYLLRYFLQTVLHRAGGPLAAADQPPAVLANRADQWSELSGSVRT